MTNPSLPEFRTKGARVQFMFHEGNEIWLRMIRILSNPDSQHSKWRKSHLLRGGRESFSVLPSTYSTAAELSQGKRPCSARCNHGAGASAAPRYGLAFPSFPCGPLLTRMVVGQAGEDDNNFVQIRKLLSFFHGCGRIEQFTGKKLNEKCPIPPFHLSVREAAFPPLLLL